MARDTDRLIPFLLIMMASVAIIGSQHSSGGYHKRPAITSINPQQPDILRLQKFAGEHNLTWKVEPDPIDGSSYCASIDTNAPDFRYMNSCDESLKTSVDNVIGKYYRLSMKVGNQ